MAKGRRSENSNEQIAASLRGNQIAEYRPDLTTVNDPATAHALRIAFDYIYQLRGQFQPAEEQPDIPELVQPVANPFVGQAEPVPSEPECIPTEFTLVNRESNTDQIRQVIVQGDYLYAASVFGVSDASPSAQVWFVRYPDAPVRVGRLVMPDSINFFAMQGRYMYAINGFTLDDQFYVVDFIDPASPTLKSTTTLSIFPEQQIVAQGKYVYVTGEDGGGAFAVVDVSNPVVPIEIIVVNLPNGITPKAIWAHGNYLFVGSGTAATSTGDLYVYDISDPTTPSLVSSVSIGGKANSIWVDGEFLYMGLDNTLSQTSLKIFNINDPTSLSLQSTLLVSSVDCGDYITGQGDHVYLSGVVDTLWQIDVTDRTAPSILASTTAGGAGSWPSIQSRHVWWNPQPSGGPLGQLESWFIGGFRCEEIETDGLQVNGTSSMDILRSRRGMFSGQVVCEELTVAQGGGSSTAGIARATRFVAGAVELAYSATISTDVSRGDTFKVVITDGNAFTLSTPINPVVNQVIDYWIVNKSGGAAGALTFGAGFYLGAAWTQPADGTSRWIEFYYDGVAWVERFRSAADISNPQPAAMLADDLNQWRDSVAIHLTVVGLALGDNMNNLADSLVVQTPHSNQLADDLNNWADDITITLT